MIKANELRVGNLVATVSSLRDGSTFVISEIRESDIITEEKGLLRFEHLRSVPLTTDWLGRMGLQPDERPINVGGNYSLILESREDVLCLVATSAMESVVVQKIQFVHQLQNLYYALTGEELSITNNHD